ncbi:MAG: YcxB family protein [Deltaproteobacteria bacterium]|nr:YcxB family protein [Deltaproteobacteria bacterium]
MKIRFNVEVEDFVFFNRFNFAQSQPLKRSVVRNQAFFAVMIMIFMAIISYRTGRWAVFMPFGALACVGYVFWLKRILLTRLEKATRQIVSKDENRLALGEHEIEICEDGIFAKGRASEGKTYWKGLTRLVRGPRYALIFTGTTTAHVIRKKSVVEGDVEAFLDEVERRMADSGTEVAVAQASGGRTAG